MTKEKTKKFSVNKIVAQFREFCKNCDGYRVVTKYENGLIEKGVYTPVGTTKCKHAWNFNIREIMEVMRG